MTQKLNRQYNKLEMPRQRYCQGLCDALRNNPAAGPKKYIYAGGKHIYCMSCDAWMLDEAMKPNGHCPCCSRQVRRRPRGAYTRVY